jgi:hypothetical protein
MEHGGPTENSNPCQPQGARAEQIAWPWPLRLMHGVAGIDLRALCPAPPPRSAFGRVGPPRKGEEGVAGASENALRKGLGRGEAAYRPRLARLAKRTAFSAARKRGLPFV